jgi:hypothetical protein
MLMFMHMQMYDFCVRRGNLVESFIHSLIDMEHSDFATASLLPVPVAVEVITSCTKAEYSVIPYICTSSVLCMIGLRILRR